MNPPSDNVRPSEYSKQQYGRPSAKAPPPQSQYGSQPPPSHFGSQPPPSQFGSHPPPSHFGSHPPPSHFGSQPPPSQYGSQPPPSQYAPSKYGSQSVGPQYMGSSASTVSGGSPNLSRQRTVRHIPLTPQGNLVIDVPVSDRVRQLGSGSNEEEFRYLRYTAATCSPDDFPKSGYCLRQQEYQRQTEVFVVVTMYNEDDYLFCKTMTALMKNIAYLVSRNRSSTWGADGWKKIVVCIVSDGRAKINKRTLNVLGIMGCFQEGLMKDSVNGKDVSAHIFEYTSQVAVNTSLKVQGHEKGFVPCQILFCLKEKNAKKINSHRWFFNAFAPLLRPKVCILIDVGTKPTDYSLYHLWKAFDKNPQIGGACGEIYAEVGTACSNLLNPLVAAQNFEYKMSNILDKPLESMFGYISVLPGAFSAYRYDALLGEPLTQYFLGETLHSGSDIFANNMYLAEDRILCFEIVTKKKARWLLKYVKSAQAETDVPDGVPEFISQRRRWLNGSFFAGVHALVHWYYIWRSGHSLFRKIALTVEFIYNFVQLFFTWFNLSFFYLTFYFLVSDVLKNPFKLAEVTKENALKNATEQNINTKYIQTCTGWDFCPVAFDALNSLYLICIIVIVICSLGNRPQGSRFIYSFIIFIFAVIMGVMLFYTGVSIQKIVAAAIGSRRSFTSLMMVPIFRDMVLATASTFGLYMVSSLLYFDPWHMFTSFLQYLFFLPAFNNILSVYSFCNLHDVSWGTKGDNNASALGGVTASKGKDGQQTVEVEFPTDQNDINRNYEKFIKVLSEPRPDEKAHRDAQTKKEDFFKQFRTRVVLTWMLCNALMIIVMTNNAITDSLSAIFKISSTNNAQEKSNPYLTFIFFSVLALSAIRFTGSTLYLIHRALGR